MKGLKVTRVEQSESLWFLDTLMRIKLPGADTGGALAVLEQVAPGGSATPMHRHDQTDEYFYVIGGDLTFYSDGASYHCGAGTFVSVPRGTVHAFRVADGAEAKLLVFSAPATFEQFVRAASVPAPNDSLPPAGPPPGPEAIRELGMVGAQHDTVLVGPPPPRV